MCLRKLFLTVIALLFMNTTAFQFDQQIIADRASAACGSVLPYGLTPGRDSTNQTIYSGGLNRSYLLHLPPNYDMKTPAPVILSFHGNNRNASEQEQLSQFSNSTFNNNSIAIYPQGFGNHWQGAPYADSSVSDTLFISDLLDFLQGSICIDPSRIYAAGKSNGGGFVSVLACDPILSGRIAAFAPASGAFYENAALTTPLDGPCKPNASRSAIPILEFHGSDDCTIPYSGGHHNDCGWHKTKNLPPIPAWLEGWARKNGCAEHVAGNNSYEYDGVVNMTSWDCGGTEAVVTGYWIEGLGHWWPSTQANDDNKGVVTVLDATAVIMDFFGQWRLSL